MAIPGASDGQEVLRRGCISPQTNDPTSFDFTGGLPTAGDETDVVAANHIITVLSVIWCEQSNAAETIYFWIVTTDSKHVQLLRLAPIAGYGTYIWNDKIVLIAGDALKTDIASSANIDVSYTYLDQDWS